MSREDEIRRYDEAQKNLTRGLSRVNRTPLTGDEQNQIQGQVVKWDKKGNPEQTIIGGEVFSEEFEVTQAIGDQGGSVIRTFREVKLDLDNPLQVG